jgi:hypothetical protein
MTDREVFWGFEVKPGWAQYTWFKLRLDQDARVTNLDDSSLRGLSRSDEGIMKLPHGKGPVTVCEEYLAGVFVVLMDKLRGDYGDILEVTPIEVYVTVPAIWGDPAKRYTKTCAKRAGFGNRSRDKIVVIAEPEAAATLALSTFSGCGIRNQLQKNYGRKKCVLDKSLIGD